VSGPCVARFSDEGVDDSRQTSACRAQLLVNAVYVGHNLRSSENWVEDGGEEFRREIIWHTVIWNWYDQSCTGVTFKNEYPQWEAAQFLCIG
jgi:hypothetical protein